MNSDECIEVVGVVGKNVLKPIGLCFDRPTSPESKQDDPRVWPKLVENQKREILVVGDQDAAFAMRDGQHISIWD